MTDISALGIYGVRFPPTRMRGARQFGRGLSVMRNVFQNFRAEGGIE